MRSQIVLLFSRKKRLTLRSLSLSLSLSENSDMYLGVEYARSASLMMNLRRPALQSFWCARAPA